MQKAFLVTIIIAHIFHFVKNIVRFTKGRIKELSERFFWSIPRGLLTKSMHRNKMRSIRAVAQCLLRKKGCVLMPPKAKFTEEEIIEAAVSITRKKGIAAVTAREVGTVLGVSSRPLFTYFDTVDELKRRVYFYAKELYQQYIEKGLSMEIPALGVGQQCLNFARNEPELYRYLFLAPPEGLKGKVTEVLRSAQEMVRESVMKIYHMDADTAGSFFRDLWLVAYSYTTLIVTRECPYTDEEISKSFTKFSLSLCKAYKEIPGFSAGSFDKDGLFTELVNK